MKGKKTLVDYIRGPEPKKMMNFRIPTELYMKAFSKAKKDGITLTRVVVAALEQYVEQGYKGK